MNPGSTRILNRWLRRLKEDGCDFSKMDEFFGYKNTENHIRKITFTRDPHITNCFVLTITQYKRECEPTQMYMKELPRELNNIIYSYVSVNRVISYALEVPSDFPFRPIIWSLISFKENGIKMPNYDANPNNMYCGQDFSPAMSVDSQILLYLSSIEWLH